MISLNCELWAAIDIVVEMLASPHNSQTFLFYLSIALFCLSQGAGSICGRTPCWPIRLKQNCTQPIAAGIGADTDGTFGRERNKAWSRGSKALKCTERRGLGLLPDPDAVGFEEDSQWGTDRSHVREELGQEIEHAQGAAEFSHIWKTGFSTEAKPPGWKSPFRRAAKTLPSWRRRFGVDELEVEGNY